MAVTGAMFGNYILKALNKEINWLTDTIKVSLHTSTFVPNQDTMIYQGSLTNEISGTGYTAGGATLASKTAVYDPATNIITLDAADVVWANSSITARYAVIYDASPGTAATNPLIGYIDFGQDYTSTAANFTIEWNASGIGQITVSLPA